MRLLSLTLVRAWWFLREVSGDRAYEAYVERGQATLSAREFYLDSLRRRYERINRCC